MGFFGNFGKPKKPANANEADAGKKKIKPLKGRANAVQDIMAFEGITQDGIIIAKEYYTKLYKLTDSNFATEPEEKQYDVLQDYEKLTNRFPENVDGYSLGSK